MTTATTMGTTTSADIFSLVATAAAVGPPRTATIAASPRGGERSGLALAWWATLALATALAGCGSDASAGVDAAADAGTADGVVGDGAAGDGAADAGSDATAADDGVAAADTTDPWAGAPAAICHPAASLSADEPLFEDATAAFGLDGPGRPLGFRISAADLDGDGFPEVVVRRNLIGSRGASDDPVTRGLTLLANRPDGKGGRMLVDDTVASGVLAVRSGQGARPCHVVVFGDADNDGDSDLFCGMHVTSDKPGDAADTSELLRNDGKGVFALAATSPFGGDARKALTSATFVDHDRDGLLDLWLGYGTWGSASTADLLWAGDGKGGFSNVTQGEGLMTLPPTLSNLQSGAAHRNTWGTGACDLNNDGHPDLYSTSYGRYFNGLWLGGGLDGGARYSDAMHSSGFGRDGDDDWTSNWNAQCYCFDNPKAEDCGKVGKPVVNCASLKAAFGGTYRWNHSTDRQPWRLGGTTAGLVCADLDRDGDLDTVQWNIVHGDVGASSDPTQVARNDGGIIPKLVAILPADNGLQRDWPDLNWNEGDMAGAVADLDLDGRLDIVVASSDYPGTRLFAWLQQPDGTFAELPLAVLGEHRRAAGLAVVDLDGDGDLDLVVGSSRARCSGASGADCPADEQVRVWRNRIRGAGQERGNFAVLHLEGGARPGAAGGANRSAIGARVEVVAGGVTQTFEVGGGYGHFGQHNGLALHVGLGASCDIEQIRVRWPDGAAATETFAYVRGNRAVWLRQGAKVPDYAAASGGGG